MEKQDFTNFVIKLARFYDKKDFLMKSTDNHERIKAWFWKVKDIPGGQALRDIYSRITDEYEYFPKNLPKAMKTHWGAWKNENQDKVIKQRQSVSGCENCVSGWINFAHKDEKTGVVYEFTCLCGHCRQIQHDKVPMKTVGQIEAEGGKVLMRGNSKPSVIFDNIDQMVHGIGEEVRTGKSETADDQIPF